MGTYVTAYTAYGLIVPRETIDTWRETKDEDNWDAWDETFNRKYSKLEADWTADLGWDSGDRTFVVVITKTKTRVDEEGVQRANLTAPEQIAIEQLKAAASELGAPIGESGWLVYWTRA